MIDLFLILFAIGGVGYGIYKHTKLQTLIASVVPKDIADALRADVELLRTDFVKYGAEITPLVAKASSLCALLKPVVDELLRPTAAVPATPLAGVGDGLLAVAPAEPTLEAEKIVDPAAELDRQIAELKAKKDAIDKARKTVEEAQANLLKLTSE